MKTVKRLQLLGLAVILVLVSACQSKPKDGYVHFWRDSDCCGRKFPAYSAGRGGRI
jgi:hypothetical protein